jgi:hypothetical protein
MMCGIGKSNDALTERTTAMFAYYIPVQKLVVIHNHDHQKCSKEDIAAFLYAVYMRHLDPAKDPCHYDGTSIRTQPNGEENLTLVMGGKVSVL